MNDRVESPDCVPEKKKRKPPKEWNPEFIVTAKAMAEDGAIDTEIAAAIGCSDRTFRKWKTLHPELGFVLRIGKVGPNEMVKRSLFMRARGFHYKAVKIMLAKDGTVLKVPYWEYVPPETLACIFFSKNRMPEEFKDVKAVEHSRLIRKESVDELTDEQLRERLAENQRERAELLARARAPEGGSH